MSWDVVQSRCIARMKFAVVYLPASAYRDPVCIRDPLVHGLEPERRHVSVDHRRVLATIDSCSQARRCRRNLSHIEVTTLAIGRGVRRGSRELGTGNGVEGPTWGEGGKDKQC